MTPQLRMILATLGVGLLLLSLALLLYALQPLPALQERFPVEPSLFAPPQSGSAWGGAV